MVFVDEGGQGIRRISVEEDVQLHQPRRTEVRDMVIEGSIALGDGLELVVEVEDHLGKRKVVIELHPVRSDIMLADQRSPLVHAQFHDRPVKICLGDNLGPDIRLFDMVDNGGGRQARRVVHIYHFPLGGEHFIRHIGHRGDDVHVELPEKALLDDFQVQQSQEAAAEAEAQRQRTLRFVGEGSVVKLEFFQRGAQFLELGGIYRVKAGEDHGLHLFKARNGLCARRFYMGDGIAHLHLHGRLDARNDIADISGTHLAGGVELKFEVAHFLRLILVAGGEELHLVSLAEYPVHHLEIGDDAAELVEDGVENEGLERLGGVSLGSGDPVHDGVQHRLHPFSGTGAHPQDFLRVAAQQVADLVCHHLRLG